jgi:type II secretory pathway component GspD/PulD (secretin)
MFGGGGATSDTTQQRIQKATQVTAVADSRIQAVIVTAPKDLMSDITKIMDEIDVASDRDQQVATIELQNADAQSVATVLQSMFQGNNTSRSGTGSSVSSALATRATQTSTTMSQTTTSGGIGGSSSGGGRGGGGGAGGF